MNTQQGLAPNGRSLSASLRNNLLKWARQERGPYLDPSTLTYQVNRNAMASSNNNLAIQQQLLIPSQYYEFKRNQFNTMNLQGEFANEYSEGMGSNDGRSPGLNSNVSGRTTRSQTQLHASMANQLEHSDPGLSLPSFSHATAANFKPQKGPATPISTSTFAVSPSPSGSYPFTNTNASDSPSSSQNVPYPRKGRPKRGNYD